MLPIPSCITAESLEELLMCSDSRKRWLNTLLHKAHPDSWPETVEPTDFYNVLHGFIQSPNGREKFNAAARKVEKKNRPIRFHEAIYKHLMVTHGSSEELNEIYRNLQKSSEGHTKLFRWVTENESPEAAARVVWATVPHKADKIQSVIDEVEELKGLLDPYQEYLADHEASVKARTTETPKVTKKTKSKSPQSDLGDNSVATALSKLQVAVSQLAVDSINSDQIANITKLATGLSASHKEKTTREAIHASTRNVIEDALRVLIAAGYRTEDDEFDTSLLVEKLSDDDVATASNLTGSLNAENEQIEELQKQLQQSVSAEQLASMTEAVQRRDQFCQDLENILDRGPGSDEPMAVPEDTQEPMAGVVLDPISGADDVEAGTEEQHPNDPLSSEVENSNQPAEETSKHDNTVAESDKDTGSSSQKEKSSPRIPPIAPAEEIVEAEKPCVSVECRLESYSIAGEVSKCYWLAWTNAALGAPGEISPIALQCVAAAGEIRPGVSPSITLRRGLS